MYPQYFLQCGTLFITIAKCLAVVRPLGSFEWNARWGLAGLALRPSGLMPVCVGSPRNLGEARRFGVGRGVKCAQSPKNGPQTVYVVPKIE